MQIEEGMQWVWLDHRNEVINLAILVFIATTLMSRFFNHQVATEKLRNTYKFASFATVIWFWAIRLDFLHQVYSRVGVKTVLFSSALLIAVGGDWFGYLLYKMATYHNLANRRSGWKGFMLDGRDNAFVFLKRALSAAQKLIKDRFAKRPSLAIPLFMLVLGVACISVVVTNTPVPAYDVQGTAGALSDSYGTGTAHAEPTPTTTPTPTATLTPTSSILEVPTLGTGTYVYEIPTRDVETLARLCVVEVRGMAERRKDACLSVVSTVFERMARHYLSDGTVAGTIAWKCYHDTIECQFPAYALHGCNGINPTACPWSYPDDIAFFRTVVTEYLKGQPRGDLCLGYVYYGLKKEFDLSECVIEAKNGSIQGFHNS